MKSSQPAAWVRVVLVTIFLQVAFAGMFMLGVIRDVSSSAAVEACFFMLLAASIMLALMAFILIVVSSILVWDFNVRQDKDLQLMLVSLATSITVGLLSFWYLVSRTTFFD